jgi:hypothetical protein
VVSSFRIYNYNFVVFPISAVLATCPTHLILLDLITLIIFGGAYELENAVFFSLSPLSPSQVQILFSTPRSQTSSLSVLPLV